MNVEIFSLCDAATSDFGKISMLGAFDTLQSEKAPVVHPQCAIALRIRFRSVEQGQHLVEVRIVNLDGQPVIPPLKGMLNVMIPDGQSSASVNLVLNLQGLRLEVFGEYSIDLLVDNQESSSLPLFVKALKRPS